MSEFKIHLITKPDQFPDWCLQKTCEELVCEHIVPFGDTIEATRATFNCIFNVLGGFVLLGELDKKFVGAVAVCDTKMTGFIPEHCLVYICVDKQYRGKGYGKQLMQKAMETCKGDIKLHVDIPNEVARKLYEKVGFKVKYYDMRYVNPNKPKVDDKKE